MNFVIPELATGLEYKKGPYYASEDDFSSAGAVSLNYADKLAQGIASVLGEYRDAQRPDRLQDQPDHAG